MRSLVFVVLALLCIASIVPITALGVQASLLGLHYITLGCVLGMLGMFGAAVFFIAFSSRA